MNLKFKIDEAVKRLKKMKRVKHKCPDCGGRGEVPVQRASWEPPIYGPGDLTLCATCMGTGDRVEYVPRDEEPTNGN